MEKGDMMSSK